MLEVKDSSRQIKGRKKVPEKEKRTKKETR